MRRDVSQAGRSVRPLWQFFAREVDSMADRMAAVSERCGEASHGKKLKTYQTSLGFFDLAMAAPSMKAALEAWGADSNLFHEGKRRSGRLAATMAKPGVRRPVGSDGSFGEDAEVPTNLGDGKKPTKAARKSKGRKAKRPASQPVDKAAERKTSAAYEREQRRRDREWAKEEATRQKVRERRQQAVDKAQAALDKAEQEHAKRAAAIQTEMEAIEKKREPKMLTGTRKEDGWKQRCGARGD
jgi:hypothetical protein